MPSDRPVDEAVDRAVIQLFALVSEALAGATHALLGGDIEIAQMVIDRDATIDGLVGRTEELVWNWIDTGVHDRRICGGSWGLSSSSPSLSGAQTLLNTSRSVPEPVLTET